MQCLRTINIMAVSLTQLSESSVLTDDLLKREREREIEGGSDGKNDVKVGPSASISSVNNPEASHPREVCVCVCLCLKVIDRQLF